MNERLNEAGRERPQMWATCWTSAGDTSPADPDPRSPLDLRTRVEAAAGAGFVGMGFLYEDLVVAEAEYGLDGIRGILEEHGMACEIEMLSGWWADGEERRASDEVRAGMLRMARRLRPRQLKVGSDDADRPFDMARWQEEFARLCAQAADIGTRVGLEFFPWANIKDLTAARELVEGAEHPAGGLVIDVWHTERHGTPAPALAAVPAERIIAVELSDAAPQVEGTLLHDTQVNRRFCGEGSFGLAEDIRALDAAGWHGPWGVEILSSSYRRLPVEEALARAFTTGRRAVAEALQR